MRLLILGDTAGTGFGTVTADLGRSLIAQGVDVRFASLNEQPGQILVEPFAGRTAEIGRGWLALPPAPRDPGPDAPDEAKEVYVLAVQQWAAYAKKIEGWATGGLFADGWPPNAALIIGDVGSLKQSPFVNHIPEGFPVYHYVPVEGIGLPPVWSVVWDRIRPVAMSEFGADQIAGLGVERPPVVYHGVDTEAFWPASGEKPIDVYGGPEASPESRELGRNLRLKALREGRRIGVTEGILASKDDCKTFIGMDTRRILIFRADRHMPRKAYPSLFRSLAPLMAKHRDVDLLYHARTVDQGGDLDDERSKYGPLLRWEACKHPGKCVRGGMHPIYGGVASRMISTQLHDHFGGATRTMLNVLYNAADLYVSNSAEGFGLTIAEAMACGVPVVGLDYSAVPEVVGPGGVVVPIRGLIDNIYSHFWALVDEDRFRDEVEAFILSRKRRREFGSRGPGHVRKNFSWDGAARAMLAVMEARQEVVAA